MSEAKREMRDTISKIFVITFFLNYLVMFGVLVRWMIRTWLPRSGKKSDAERFHGVARPH